MEPIEEAAAMAKLLRRTVPYGGPRYEIAVQVAREAGLDERADRLASERIEGELFRLTPLDLFELETWIGQAQKRIQDREIDTDVRAAHLWTLRCKLYALYALRRTGTDGKVRLLTEQDAHELDPQVAGQIMASYLEAFVLTETERPKAEAPRSTDESKG